MIPPYLDYYLKDIWRVKDIRVAELPLIGSGPWFLLAFTSIYLLLSSRISRLMKSRPPVFLRPIQIVYYGLMFGIHGVAVPVILALSVNPLSAFKCNLGDTVNSDLRGTMFIYCGLLYLFIKMFSVLDLLLLLWTKTDEKVTFGRLMESILQPFVVYGLMKYYPGGITYFYLTFDCIVNTIKYGLSTRSCAGEDLKPISNWEEIVHHLKCFQYIIGFGHALYTLSIENCDCPVTLRYYIMLLQLYLFFSYIFGDNVAASKDSKTNGSSVRGKSISNRKIAAKVK